MIILEFLFVVVDGVLFDRWGSRPIRLHVLRIIGTVACLEIHRLILLLLIRPHWLQRIFRGIRIISQLLYGGVGGSC